jgi:DNA-binding GntR family transcriptional regulator
VQTDAAAWSGGEVTGMTAGDRPAQGRGYGAQAIHRALQAEILALDLAPGQLIDEASLAERFGVSRSPVREALVRLAGEGLVSTLPNKGTVVTPVALDAFPKWIDALDLVQRAVTRLAAILHGETDLARIEAADALFLDRVAAGDVMGMIEANKAFHMEIAAAARNRYLAEAYGRLLDEGRRSLRLYFRSYGDTLPPDLPGSHDRIVAAIRDRDADRAERMAGEHADEVHQRFVAYMTERRTRDMAVGRAPRDAGNPASS